MPYEVYKIIHLLMVVVLLTALSVGFWNNGNQAKILKILGGVATLLILVSGMGLMARLGIGHTGGWPVWIKLKMFFWLLLGVGGPMILKRAPSKGKTAYWAVLIIFSVIVYLVNYKPE